MSRIGKHPVPVPAGVQASVAGQTVTAKGKLGQLTVTLVEDVAVTLESGSVRVVPRDPKDMRGRMMWGLSRTLVANLIHGVEKGYQTDLEITGTGYKAAVAGKELVLNLGFSHEVRMPIPDGIAVKCEKPTLISISGADKQRVGQYAANIRKIRPPEPYKGKGVRYTTETILRKEGKKK